MRSYRAYSDLNWGPRFCEADKAHHCEAEDAECAAKILPTHAARGFSSMQVNIAGEWRWVSEVPLSLGGISRSV